MSSFNLFKRSETKLNDKNQKFSGVNTGTEVKKEYLVKNFEHIKKDWAKYCSLWRAKPDLFLDFISDKKSRFKLYYYQRVMLRILFRYRKVFITATRGISKSFLSILALYLRCIMFPNIKMFIVAPGKEQAAKIAQEKIEEIWSFFPILENEIKYHSFQKDFTKIVFKNGSKLDIVQMRDSARGGRRHSGLIEEVSSDKVDPHVLNSVVIPLMANDRIASCGGVDPNELQRCQYYICTAGIRQSFAFNKLNETIKDMIEGKSAFMLGSSYQLATMHGQLDEEFINEQKESGTYSIHDFMREYESVWTGTDESSLVQLDDLNKCRTLETPEFKAEKEKGKDIRYILSYDVARSQHSSSALSSLAVFKIIGREDGTFKKLLVNMFSFEGTHFLEQALFIKKKVNDYKASMIIVDANGIGSAVVDYLITEIDENPSYSVINDDTYNKFKKQDSIPILFAMKSNNRDTKSSDIHNNFMRVIANNDLKMLIPESSAKQMIQQKKISNEEMAKQIQPFLFTDLLCEEIMNLQYIPSGTETKVKQLSGSIPKDKFSAVEYGLYCIYMMEKDNKKRKKEVIGGNFEILVRRPNIRKN